MGKIIGKIKDKVKKQLVYKNVFVKEKYWEYYAENPGNNIIDRTKKLLKIIQLNFTYRSNTRVDEEGDTLDIEEFIQELLKYDVISFDIFDTLLLRLVEKPIDVFAYIEGRYHFPHFQDIRVQSEIEARRESETGEVNLKEIYAIIAKKTNINVDEWMNREIQAEYLLCKQNPFMYQVFTRLKEKNKRIIAVSDMYLSQNVVEELLKRCGYSGLEKIFISNTYRFSKARGKLYHIVREYVKEATIVHIGDNITSDYAMARKMGFDAKHYYNVNAKYGVNNLLYGMTRLTGAFTKGIVNSYLNNGLNKKDEYFKYGMINGGLLTCGYCEYINKIVDEQQVDKIIFVARDGYIIKQVYEKYYKKCNSEYMLFSRFCAEQILFDKYTEDYIKHNMGYRLSLEKKVSLRQLLAETDLGFLEIEFTKRGFDLEEKLTDKNYKRVIEVIYNNKDKINEYFDVTRQNMLEYLKPMLDGCYQILVVDLGWFGTGGTAIKYLLEEKYNTGIKVISALVGTNEDTSLEGRIANQELFPYAYSPVHNLYLLYWHTRHQYNVHNLLIELMFSAPHPSFLKFVKNEEGELEPLFSYEENENHNMITSIHEGILEFAKMYADLDDSIKSLLQINGGDAYAAFMCNADDNKKCYELFKDYKISQLSGIFGIKSITTMGEIMREDHYI